MSSVSKREYRGKSHSSQNVRQRAQVADWKYNRLRQAELLDAEEVEEVLTQIQEEQEEIEVEQVEEVLAEDLLDDEEL
jgi:hypothetical protein